MALKLITAPERMPVTLEEAKAHLEVEHNDRDDAIQTMIAAATAFCEGPDGVLQLALNPQTWEWSLDCFPSCRWWEVPLKKLIAVDSIKYTDVAGDEQTIDAENYTVDTASIPGRIVFISGFVAPTTLLGGANVVRVRFQAGYPEDQPDSGIDEPPTSTVPSPIKIAIMMMVGDMFDNRETVSADALAKIPSAATVDLLLRPFKPFILA